MTGINVAKLDRQPFIARDANGRTPTAKRQLGTRGGFA
jgi:hypothetical protein